MISTSTDTRVAFTPQWRDGQPEAPVFYLRAGSVIERGQMEAELAGDHRAGKVWGYELRMAVRAGMETLLADDPDLDRMLALIDAEAEGDATLTDEDRRILAESRKLLAEHWPDYRDLVAQLERRREIAPIVALRRFCVDIVATGVTFAKGPDGLVSEATLRALDPLEMSAAGNRAFALQFPPADAEGNFARPSPSDKVPTTSRSGARSRVGGKSEKPSGKKTLASSSRRGSGRSSTSTSSAAVTPPQ